MMSLQSCKLPSLVLFLLSFSSRNATSLVDCGRVGLCRADDACTGDINLYSRLACHPPTRPVWQALMLYLVGSAERPPAASPLLPPAAPLPVDALLSAAGLLSLAQRAPPIKTLYIVFPLKGPRPSTVSLRSHSLPVSSATPTRPLPVDALFFCRPAST